MWLSWTCWVLATASVDAGTTVDKTAATSGDVSTRMRMSFSSLMALQPYLASSSLFIDPKNQASIAIHVETLASLKHAFPKEMEKEEPGLAAISKLFSRYIDDTQKRWKEGEKEYARYRLRTVTGLCFGCHGQVHSEKDFVDAKHQVDSLPLSPLERADYLAATRQFELAMKAYEEVLKGTPDDELGYLEFLRAVRQLLSLTVRVKQDAQSTLNVLQTLAARKDLPPFVTEYLLTWKKDASAWKNDAFKPNKATVAQMISKAQSLVTQAGGTRTLLPDEHQQIPFLRASGYLHEALRKEPTSALRGEALYLLGLCYAELQDSTLWELDSLYLEACVRENPHSGVAKKCLRRLTDRIYLGYTGSRGTQLPADEVERLSELRQLAE